MHHRLPDPTLRNPLVLPGGTRDPATVFLNQVIDHPNIEIGDWSYYHDRRLPENYAETLAPYLFQGAPECLKIGRFCQIAEGVEFITATANHSMTGISTYPFAVFDPPRFAGYRASLPRGRDTILGNDCWIGRGATLLPGAEIGNGVIVAANAVVRGKIPDYAVVSGNTAEVVRMRFTPQEIKALLDLRWWDWPPNAIEDALPALEAGDISALVASAQRRD